jgi:hypothetical protein
MMRTSPFVVGRRASHATIAETTNMIRRSGGNVDDDDEDNEGDEEFVDPYSDRARLDLLNFYVSHDIVGTAALDADAAYDKLIRLTERVLMWNERLNLIFRKDCDARVIYHKHVLPSVALLPLILEGMKDANECDVIDVGTGGGVPRIAVGDVIADRAFHVGRFGPKEASGDIGHVGRFGRIERQGTLRQGRGDGYDRPSREVRRGVGT